MIISFSDTDRTQLKIALRRNIVHCQLIGLNRIALQEVVVSTLKESGCECYHPAGWAAKVADE